MIIHGLGGGSVQVLLGDTLGVELFTYRMQKGMDGRLALLLPLCPDSLTTGSSKPAEPEGEGTKGRFNGTPLLEDAMCKQGPTSGCACLIGNILIAPWVAW